MSTSRVNIVAIDTESALRPLITEVIRDRPLLYLHIVGPELGDRHLISIMTLYIPSKNVVYLLDIEEMRHVAFTTTNADGKSLKYILELPSLRKVIFDIRHGSDSLFYLYQIRVKGIRDVQLMETVLRWGRQDTLGILSVAMQRNSTFPEALVKKWCDLNSKSSYVFNPLSGGRRGTFGERPIRQDIMRYVVAQVAVLPDLYNVYCSKLQQSDEADVRARVAEATRWRLIISQRPRAQSALILGWRGPWDDAYDHAVENGYKTPIQIAAPEDGVNYGVSYDHDEPEDDEYGLECFEKVWDVIGHCNSPGPIDESI
ncbi:hypothetical protein N7478_001829 [Penicillium angulare]|uniref:uncharacterized protein n=1 Tax=Penicillium angulare TaxID=116970 RepID=UPI00253FDC39|nr:uncharacterized protein N7478_001829 [Penicillium angulare]KAJ5288799.1 hypothetical protein N7478_001829 [Penicillium angulare]